MASSKRERELARMRVERQTARRAAVAARRRQRNATLGAVAGVLAVVLIAVGVFLATRSTTKAPVDALKNPPATPTASATPVPAPKIIPGECSYTKSGTAAKPVKLPPPTTKVEITKPFTASLVTNRGAVTFTLLTAKASCTVNSFRALAAGGYFDKTPCHRLTTQGIFVLQCGDPSGTGSGGPGYAFADENLTGATYPRGTVAMANSGAGTNGSQFFLVYKDSQLPPKYTPFGKITKGLDVIDKVAAGGSTPANDGKPKLGVQILKATSKAAAA